MRRHCLELIRNGRERRGKGALIAWPSKKEGGGEYPPNTLMEECETVQRGSGRVGLIRLSKDDIKGYLGFDTTTAYVARIYVSYIFMR